MEFSFDNRAIRQICEDENVATEKFGAVLAQKLKNRLADLWAAECVVDIPVGDPGALPDGLTYKINLSDTHRIVFGAIHSKLSKNTNGQIDWSNVSRIKLLKIEEYGP